MRSILAILGLVMVLGFPERGGAQYRRDLRVGITAPEGASVAGRVTGMLASIRESRTYWKEGGIAGGVVTAAIGFIFLMDKDSKGDRAAPLYAIPPLTVLSALVGFGPGALVGSLIPKRPPADSTATGSH